MHSRILSQIVYSSHKARLTLYEKDVLQWTCTGDGILDSNVERFLYTTALSYIVGCIGSRVTLCCTKDVAKLVSVEPLDSLSVEPKHVTSGRSGIGYNVLNELTYRVTGNSMVRISSLVSIKDAYEEWMSSDALECVTE